MRRIVVVLGIASILGSGCTGAGQIGTGQAATSTSATSTAATSAAATSAVGMPPDGAAARAELAATGPLRFGFPAAPPFLGQQDANSGRWSGLAITFGDALATRLGVALAPARYANPAATYQALLAGDVDVVLAQIPFKPAAASSTEAVVRLEHTYLVGSSSSLGSAADVDRAGIKVGSVADSPHTAFLAAHLQQAQLVQLASAAEALAALASGRIDAYADVRFALTGLVAQAPGSRVLDGSFFTPGFGLVTMSSRTAGAAFLSSFVAAELAGGDVQHAVDAIGKPGLLAGPAA